MTRSKRSTLLIVAAVLVLLLAAAAFLLTRGKPAEHGAAKSKEAAAQPKPAITVTVAKPEISELAITLAANGNVAAWQEAIVGTEATACAWPRCASTSATSCKQGPGAGHVRGRTVRPTSRRRAPRCRSRGQRGRRRRQRRARARTLQSHRRAERSSRSTSTSPPSRPRRRASRRPAPRCQAQQVRVAQTRRCWRPTTASSRRAARPSARCCRRRHRTVPPDPPGPARMARRGAPRPSSAASSRAHAVRGHSRPAARRSAARCACVAPTVDPQTRTALVYVDLPGRARNAPSRPACSRAANSQLGSGSALTVPQQAVRAARRLQLRVPSAAGQPRQRRSRSKPAAAWATASRSPAGCRADARVVVAGARLPERRRPGAHRRGARRPPAAAPAAVATREPP